MDSLVFASETHRSIISGPSRVLVLKVGVEAVAMTDETVVDVLEVAEKVLVEVSERVKVGSTVHPSSSPLSSVHEVVYVPVCGDMYRSSDW